MTETTSRAFDVDAQQLLNRLTYKLNLQDEWKFLRQENEFSEYRAGDFWIGLSESQGKIDRVKVKADESKESVFKATLVLQSVMEELDSKLSPGEAQEFMDNMFAAVDPREAKETGRFIQELSLHDINYRFVLVRYDSLNITISRPGEST